MPETAAESVPRSISEPGEPRANHFYNHVGPTICFLVQDLEALKQDRALTLFKEAVARAINYSTYAAMTRWKVCRRSCPSCPWSFEIARVHWQMILWSIIES